MNSRKILALLVSGLLAMPAAGMAQSRHQQGMDQSSQGQGMGAMMGQGTQGMQGMHGMMMRMHSGSGGPMMGMGMMNAMMAGPGPGLILRQRETLELTDAQVQKLEALRDQLASAHKSHMEAMKSLDQEAQGVLTEEQAKKLQVGMQFMRGMMGMLGGQKGAMNGGAGMGMMGQKPCSTMSGSGS